MTYDGKVTPEPISRVFSPSLSSTSMLSHYYSSIYSSEVREGRLSTKTWSLYLREIKIYVTLFCLIRFVL